MVSLNGKCDAPESSDQTIRGDCFGAHCEVAHGSRYRQSLLRDRRDMGRICINEDDLAACPSEVGADRAANGTAAPDDNWIVCFNHDFIPIGGRRLLRAKRRPLASRARGSRWLRGRAAVHKRRGSAEDHSPRSGRHGRCRGRHARQCGPRSRCPTLPSLGARWTFSGRIDANTPAPGVSFRLSGARRAMPRPWASTIPPSTPLPSRPGCSMCRGTPRQTVSAVDRTLHRADRSAAPRPRA